MTSTREPARERGVEARLTAIEEAEAFTERTVEELSAEIAELNRRVRDLVARTEALERRLTSVIEHVEEREAEADDETV